MALVVHGNEGALAKLGVDPDSTVPFFWAKIAEQRPTAAPNMAEICRKIGATIESDYFAMSCSEMPLLMSEWQLQQVIVAAGGKSTWSGLVTFALGPFKSSAPQSASLVSTPDEDGADKVVVWRPPVKAEATFEIMPIGAAMEAEGSLAEEVLPEYIFDAVYECEDPSKQALTRNDVSAVLNEYSHFMITVHKQPAGDKPLRLWHAKQLKRRLPHLPDHGDGKPGETRKWITLLNERKRNLGRNNALKVRRSPMPQCPAHHTGYLLCLAPRSRPAPPSDTLCCPVCSGRRIQEHHLHN